MSTIHPTAVVSSRAVLGEGVEIGPFCIVEPDVTIGAHCVLGGHVTVKQGTHLGPDNQIGEGAVLGGRPQHLRAGQEVGGLRIGARNHIRESATLHRAVSPGSWTTVGDDNMIMVAAHVAHDCQVGNRVILANNVMLAGHVVVDDSAYLSGAVGVHQFCRIGRQAMVGGQSHVTRDVAPFVTVDGVSSRVVGLNFIGLRRAGYSSQDVAQLKAAYRLIFRSGLAWNDILATLKTEFATGPASLYAEFLANCRRGIVRERRAGRHVRLAELGDSGNDSHPDRMAS